MPFSPLTYEEKPYNRCVDCIYIGKKCDGPNFLAMTTRRMCEWARLRKEYLHSQDGKWTNAYIAELTGLSKTTVDRFFAGDIDDTKVSTAAQILKILVNGTWGQYPCSLAADNSSSSETEKECEHLKELLESEKRKTEYLKKQVEFKESQMLEKDKLIEDRKKFLKLKDKTIQVLAVLLGICVLIIITALVVDKFNPNVGYFWLQ